MSNGLYSGVSGLALGVGLYKGVSGLWGGASGLIDGFGGGFSPASLFAAGEPGGWYDPSDLSTMFQDSAGTTPVTATGQTVGLLLDKSKGLALGPERVVNGDFSSGFGTGWTNISEGIGTATITGGRLQITTTDSSNRGSATQSFSTTIGRSYTTVWTAGGVSIGNGQFRVGNSSNAGDIAIYNASLQKAIFVATATTTFVSMTTNAGATTDLFFDNISIKELAGNHLTQATAASRPQYQIDGSGFSYLLFDGTDDSFISPTITPGIDKAQVFAGVRKLSDAAYGCIAETSTGAGGNPALAVFVDTANSGKYYLQSGSLSTDGTTNATSLVPATDVVTVEFDRAGAAAANRIRARIDGVVSAITFGSTGAQTGNFGTFPLYVGRRAGTTLPFNGRIYQLIVRFGANLDAATIAATETYVDSKTGAIPNDFFFLTTADGDQLVDGNGDSLYSIATFA